MEKIQPSACSVANNEKGSPDTGLNVTGQYTDVNKTGMTFIAIGNEPDGKKFRETLQDAIAKA